MPTKLYKLDKKKEKKSTIITLLIVFIFFAFMTLVSFWARGANVNNDLYGYGVMFLLTYSLFAYIIYTNSLKELEFYKLELIDQDNFAVTNIKNKTKRYTVTQIKNIGITNNRLYSIELHDRKKRLSINYNLEKYDEVINYFQQMAARLQLLKS